MIECTIYPICTIYNSLTFHICVNLIDSILVSLYGTGRIYIVILENLLGTENSYTGSLYR